jgi:hypothetical protein
VIRSLEVAASCCEIFVLEQAQSGEKALAGRASQRLAEGPGTVLIESRRTVAFCLTDFKESRVCVRPGAYLKERPAMSESFASA